MYTLENGNLRTNLESRLWQHHPHWVHSHFEINASPQRLFSSFHILLQYSQTENEIANAMESEKIANEFSGIFRFKKPCNSKRDSDRLSGEQQRR